MTAPAPELHLDVARALSEWFTSSAETGKACKPDARVKMYPDQQEAAAVLLLSTLHRGVKLHPL